VVTPAAAYHPRVGRLALLNAAGMTLLMLGLGLGNLAMEQVSAPWVFLARLLGILLLVVAIPAIMTLSPPLLQGLLRRSATLELVEDGVVLAPGFDRKRKVSWSDVSSVASVRLKPPLAVGWVTIVFTRPRQPLGRELSLPDLYLDRGVEEVAGVMQERLERWRYPFGRPNL